ncbi:MAG: PIN domain-containing protein [Candidatus Woesearchaeota archaeon]|nr:PIN domain-containing protein [Candidatus Woesearchaeota archaeon]
MIYAESDFFFAIAKKSDWLKKNAKHFWKKYRGNIVTDSSTLIELAMTCHKYNLSATEVISSVFQIAHVEGIRLREALEAAHLIEEYNVTPFDSFHAVFAGELPILSSDNIYDKLGKERIKLEG